MPNLIALRNAVWTSTGFVHPKEVQPGLDHDPDSGEEGDDLDPDTLTLTQKHRYAQDDHLQTSCYVVVIYMQNKDVRLYLLVR